MLKSVSWGNWFGGVYIDEKNFFPNFCVEPTTYFALYPEFVLDELEKKAFLFDRKGAVAGRKLAAKYGWKIGDTITLKGTIYPGNWDFVLRGIYQGRDRTVDETQFFFHWAYLNEAVKKMAPVFADKVGFYMVGLSRPDIAADTALAIDNIFKNSLAETLTETEKAFNLGFIAMSEAIVTAIQMVSFIIILIIMAVVANTMAMTTRERTGDYAIMKTLGFGAKDIYYTDFRRGAGADAHRLSYRRRADVSRRAHFRRGTGNVFPRLSGVGRYCIYGYRRRPAHRVSGGDHSDSPRDPHPYCRRA